MDFGFLCIGKTRRKREGKEEAAATDKLGRQEAIREMARGLVYLYKVISAALG